MMSFFKRDSVWAGLTIGLLVPLAVYGLLRLIYEWFDHMEVFSDVGFAEDFRTRTLALIAICANLLMMQSFRKSHRHYETTRGILMASMIYVAIWFWKFGFKMLDF